MDTILVVDDDRHFIQHVRKLISGFGHASDFVTRAERLIPKLEREAIDLVLMDINMPGEDGVSMLKRLKAHPLHRAIPVIMLTVESNERVLANCFEHGAVDFIAKPVGELVLKARVQSALAARKSEAALKESVSLLRSTIESSADGILVVDNQGKFSIHNRRFVEMWRIPEEILSTGMDDKALAFFAERVRNPDAFVLKMKELNARPGAKSVDVIHLRDGRILDRHSWPRRMEGRIVGRVWSFRDITEKRMMEAQLLRSCKLESIGLLAGGIAHDFNNLLSGIMGSLSLARLDADSEDHWNNHLDVAEKAATSARDLTGKLLTFAEGGAPAKRETAISPLLGNAVELALTGSRIAREFLIANPLPPVEIDETQISQAIQHLAANALEAMPEGGRLVVGAEKRRLEDGNAFGVKGGDYVKLWIRDTGAGIPENNMEKIFDPYFSTKEMGVQKGMGMGLPICHSIFKNHGGGVVVDSAEGEGTTVAMVLPAISVESDTAAVKRERPVGHSSPNPLPSPVPRALLMDDEDFIREIGGQMLQRLGYDVETAVDGDEAVALYRKAMEARKPFTVAILDLTIRGGMGGKATMRELLEVDPHVKGIVSSGYSNDPVMAGFRSHGFCGALPKAYTMRQLDGVLRKTLGEKHPKP